MVSFARQDTIFSQGDSSDALFLVQKGKVRLSVRAERGKEATLAILGEDDFFGEGCLASQLVRMSSATAVTDCVLLHIERKAMISAMNREPKLAVAFVTYLLRRIIRDQEDLTDQRFNVSEKRLARVLLSMGNFDKAGVVDFPIPELSQQILSELVGTTRSRVSFFMNRFRKLGLISYRRGEDLRIRSSLRSVLQNDAIEP